jgi:hypothetical protein
MRRLRLLALCARTQDSRAAPCWQPRHWPREMWQRDDGTQDSSVFLLVLRQCSPDGLPGLQRLNLEPEANGQERAGCDSRTIYTINAQSLNCKIAPESLDGPRFAGCPIHRALCDGWGFSSWSFRRSVGLQLHEEGQYIQRALALGLMREAAINLFPQPVAPYRTCCIWTSTQVPTDSL